MSKEGDELKRSTLYTEAVQKYKDGLKREEATAALGAMYPSFDSTMVAEVTDEAYTACCASREKFGGRDGPPCDLDVDRNNVVKATVANFVRMFGADEPLKHCLQWNELTSSIEVGEKSPPWLDYAAKQGEPLTEISFQVARSFFSRAECLGYRMNEAGADTLYAACSVVAYEARYHPIKIWLQNLVYDGKPRLDMFWHSVAGVKPDDYHVLLARVLFLGLIERAFNPGCAFDVIPTLSGPQGIGKSRLWAVLGYKWFSDSFLDFHNKDIFSNIAGIWLHELAELSSVKRADNERLKAFISSRTDTYRPSYGRTTASFPRTTVFVGSTNADDFLSDDTGNRRWLPIVCPGTIDVAWAAEHRDQLYAEAFARYALKERWLDAYLALKPHQEKQTEAVAFQDDRCGTICNWLRQPDTPDRFTLLGMMDVCFPKEKLGVSEQRIYGGLLRQCGCKKIQRRVPGTADRHNFWYKPGTSENQEVVLPPVFPPVLAEDIPDV